MSSTYTVLTEPDLKSITITEVKISYRRKKPANAQPIVNTSELAYSTFMSFWDTNKIDLQEQCNVLLLTNRCELIGAINVATGGATSCVIDNKMIFIAALKANACCIVFAHNHPSGYLKASQQDIAATEKLAVAAKALDIRLLDSMIVTSESYYSFADEGLLPG